MSLNAAEITQLRPLLGKVSFFQHLEPQELDTVAAALDKVSFRSEEVLIRQGDPGDAFYLLASGTVEVWREPEGSLPRVRLGTLAAGGFFGEIALLFDIKRTATVVGVLPGDLYRMSRGNFEVLVASNKLVGDVIRVTAQQRLAKEDSAPN